MPVPEPIAKLARYRFRVAGHLVKLYLRGVSKTLRRLGYKISPSAQGYFKAEEVIDAALKRKLTVPEYLEAVNLGQVGKRRDYIIDQLLVGHPSNYGSHLLEIGSGTCMFLEKIAEAVQPTRVEIYEPDEGWRRYAKARISELPLEVAAWHANGCSLDRTGSECVDTVFAHGVFVYIPLLVTWGYMQEAARVLKPGGRFVFDAFLAGDSIFTTLEEFRSSNPPGSVFPVFLHPIWIDAAAHCLGFEIEGSFMAPYYGIRSTYIIFRKQFS